MSCPFDIPSKLYAGSALRSPMRAYLGNPNMPEWTDSRNSESGIAICQPYLDKAET
jgi:hypothetical protein